QFMPQESSLTTGVHHETSPGNARNTVGSVTRPTGLAVFEEHIHDLMAFPDLDTMRSAIVQKQLIELGAPDLVRVRIALIGLTEIPTPGRLVRTPDHGGAPFLQKSCFLHSRQDPQLFQDGNTGGQE